MPTLYYDCAMWVIYTIHLDEPLGDDGNGGRSRAGHYTGWTRRAVPERIAEHRRRRAGDGLEHTGGQLLAHANSRGIGWRVVEVRPGTPYDEHRLKANGRAWRRCPVCNPAAAGVPRLDHLNAVREHKAPGAVGVLSQRVYYFGCGGCPAVLSVAAENLDDAKAGAKLVAGWKNGRRQDLAHMPDGTLKPSSWRCEDCANRASYPGEHGAHVEGEPVPDPVE